MMKSVETADTLYIHTNNSRESNRGSPSVEVYMWTLKTGILALLQRLDYYMPPTA